MASLQLAGCFPLALTGAAVGTMAVVDRRTIGAQTEDQEIELRAMRVLNNLPKGMASASVTSYNRRVLVTGQVNSQKSKPEIDAALRREIPNIREIFNELEVRETSSFGTRARDFGLTARVKTALVRERSIASTAIKIVTEESTVFLMGLVSEEEGEKAALLASRQSGVSRVVTLFEYLSAQEVERIEGERRLPPPNPNTGTTPTRS